MHILSTCTACNELLHVVDPFRSTHPTCTTNTPTDDPLVNAYLAAVDSSDEQQANQLEQAIDAVDRRRKPLGPAAMAYATWGWPVFPLQPGEKAPFAGSRGLRDATIDPDRIRRWWVDNPNANIGLATGHTFDVLDVDFTDKNGKPTGAATSWPELRDSTVMPEVHGLATTPRGGVHVLLLPTGGGNMAGFRPGLDYRGTGGYIVAAPSRRADGRRYQWWVRPSPAVISSAVVAA